MPSHSASPPSISERILSFLNSALELCCLLIAFGAAGYGAFIVFLDRTQAPVESIANRAETIDSIQRRVAQSRMQLRFQAREVARQAGELLGAEPGDGDTSRAPQSGNPARNQRNR